MKELVAIQSELNAPKGQYNKFGQYYYRNCEDILAAVKPLLGATNCTLTISDDIITVGERIYVKAIATLSNASGERVTTQAFAREESEKKGMDVAQITGAASSYARKYALNGLFAIDDVKDADDDATNTHGKEAPKPAAAPARTTRTTAKPAPAPKPTAPAPAQPTKEMSDTFVALCVSNITQKDFLAAFKSLLQSNPAFNTDYWKQEANKYYKSLNA